MMDGRHATVPSAMETAMRKMSRLVSVFLVLAAWLSPAVAPAGHAILMGSIRAGRFMTAAADAPGISVEHAWARPTPGAATAGAAYFTLTNNGPVDQLVGAGTPVAAAAGVHETTNDNGVMKMRPVAAVALDPGKPVTFKPGGYHVMLMGLKGALKAGGSFPLTLTFAHAQPVTVTVNVEAMGGTGTGMGGMPGMR
jgi:copper(I)-binding protein